MFRFVQRCYCVLGMLQLTFMISFSRCYMPTTCSLVHLFNVTYSPSSCAGTSDPRRNGSDPDAGGSAESSDRASWLWLLWPMVLCAGTACDVLVDVFWISVASFCKYAGNCDAGVTHRGAERWPTKVVLVCGQVFPALSFCASVFVWYYRHETTSDDDDGGGTRLLPYLEATAMVFLFGWTTNLVFFSGMTQRFDSICSVSCSERTRYVFYLRGETRVFQRILFSVRMYGTTASATMVQ